MAAPRASTGKPVKAKTNVVKKTAAKASAKSKLAKKIPAKKTSAKKNPAKKFLTKNSPAKKTSAKKGEARKTPGKKVSGKKVAATKPLGKKPVTKNAAAKKSRAKKSAGKQSVNPNSSKKKTGAKKVLAKRPEGNTANENGRVSRLTDNIVRVQRTVKAARNRRLATRTPVGREPVATTQQTYDPVRLQQLRVNFDPADLDIREACPTDYVAISLLLENAFPGSSDDILVKTLRADGHMICEMVSEYRGILTGHAGFFRLEAALDGRACQIAALAPLAVESSFRALGIARRIISQGLSEVRRWGAEGVFVVGDIDYFAQFGFSNRLARRFTSQFPETLLNAFEFAPGSLACKSGPLTYPAPY